MKGKRNVTHHVSECNAGGKRAGRGVDVLGDARLSAQRRVRDPEPYLPSGRDDRFTQHTRTFSLKTHRNTHTLFPAHARPFTRTIHESTIK